MVSVRALTKRFGDVTAVDHLDLDIYPGELFSILGGSGSGKTTLLRMLAGFEAPTSGSILIDGVDMTRVPPYKRPVNMMFQSYALFPHMTVEQNVAYGLKKERVPAAEIRERVAAILEKVRMGRLAKRKPNALSGGESQRVALARALIKRPKLLLLDEPLAALDKKLRQHTQFELMNLQDELGVTFIVVTHDQEEAMTLSTRIAVMNSGSLEQVGTPGEVYEYPVNRFVADFVGNVNLFEATVSELDGEMVNLDCADTGATLVARQARDHEPRPGERQWV
ncbi:MAG: ABC transporter ATP-binding protein, partial [Lysobacterales bacterium]